MLCHRKPIITRIRIRIIRTTYSSDDDADDVAPAAYTVYTVALLLFLYCYYR
jgi:hypothetical protein